MNKSCLVIGSGPSGANAALTFGESYIDLDDYKWRDEHDQECIKKMLKAIDNKSLIYYTSSW